MKIVLGILITISLALGGWGLNNSVANSKGLTAVTTKVNGCKTVHKAILDEFKGLRSDVNSQVQNIRDDVGGLKNILINWKR